MERKACEGAATISVWTASGIMEECVECERRVASDLTENGLFGFQNCPKKAGAEGKGKDVKK